MARPLWVAKLFVKCPYIPIIFITALLLFCAGLTFAEDLMSLKSMHERDMLVWDDDRVYSYDI